MPEERCSTVVSAWDQDDAKKGWLLVKRPCKRFGYYGMSRRRYCWQHDRFQQASRVFRDAVADIGKGKLDH